jgi:hypothetical protein
MRGFQFLNDIPTTVCLLAAVAIVIDEVDREGGPTYRLCACAPAFAAALYLRYGSAPVIGIVLITAGVVVDDPCARHGRRHGRRDALVVPFFVCSVSRPARYGDVARGGHASDAGPRVYRFVASTRSCSTARFRRC